MKDVRDSQLEYKGEKPIDFNLIGGVLQHKQLIKLGCDLYRN